MRFVDLSHPLIDGQPAFPGDPVLSVREHYTTASPARCNVSQIAMGSHQGTHLDAMFHFRDDGKTIDQMPLEWFYGPARVLRIPKSPREEITTDDFLPFEPWLTPGARIIYETGWHWNYGTAAYFEDFPSLTQEAARYLVSRQIRLLGMDTPTPGRDMFEVHHILLGADIVIVESLANLHLVPDEITFCGFPLNFQGRDGSPPAPWRS